jgi:myo-inositol-1(or 4)-monophosphatase
MELESLCNSVCNISIKVGDFIRREKDKLREADIKIKGTHNYVTYVDKQSELKLIKELEKLLPEAGFIVEEGTIEKSADRYNWIIDPLDGTTNFIHAIPVFSISIALMEEEEVILGVIYDISRDECFYAWKGSRAYLNGRVISVSEAKSFDNSLIATGFPYEGFTKMNDYLLLLKELLEKSHGIRRLGSASIDMAYVACGRLEGFYEYGLNPWDVAAGDIIIKQAGGIVSDFSGGNNYIFGKDIIGSNKGIYKDLLKIVRKYFG